MRMSVIPKRSSVQPWLLAMFMSIALAACSDDDVANDFPEEPTCEEGATRTVVCGDDEQGDQAQVCRDDVWVNEGACEEEPVALDCEDGDTRTIECGEDNAGDQAQECADGTWADVGTCELPDDSCEEGDTRTGSCGMHGNGEQPEVCENEAWVANGECVDHDACLLNDDTNRRCEAGIVRGATLALPNAGFWQAGTLSADEPPALARVDAAQLTVTDMGGNPVAFDVETDEDGNQTLTWTHIEGAEGQEYEIVRGEYPFYVWNDEDEAIAQGVLPLRSDLEQERSFVLKGLSLDVQHDEDGAARAVALSDVYREIVEPIHIEEASDRTRRDYLIPSNTRYRFDVPATEGGSLGIHREILSPNNSVRYTRIDRTPAVIVPYRVTKGAEFGAWIKPGFQHFARFHNNSAILDEDASDADYDHYNVYVKSNEQYSIHASLPGEFTKEVLVERYSDAPTEPIVIDIEPADLDAVGNNGSMEANLFTNVDHSGVVSLFSESTGSQTFTLDVLRVWQAMQGAVMNLFFEPAFTIDMHGDANVEVTASESPGRERFRIDAFDDGVSVLTVRYAPLRLTQNGSANVFNAIAPEKSATIVVQVGELNADNLDLNLDATEYDTWYFDAAQGDNAPLNVAPTADADIEDLCVHAPLTLSTWGEGWTCVEAENDGSYTVPLKEGSNIVRARTEHSSAYHVVRAKGLDITIENETNPGQALSAGDTATITLDGLGTPVQKIAGIYNPAFGAVYVQYDLDGEIIRSPGSQFDISTTGSVLSVTFEDSGAATLDGGRIHSTHFGSKLDTHKHISAGGPTLPFTAPALEGREFFGQLPSITVQVD